MPNAPKLPSQISSDGREVWDWAAKFSAHVHQQSEIRRLKADIAGIGKRCGDCDNWMKSRQCPQERNVNGRNRGPSMNGFICQKFVECRFAMKRRAELKAELAQVMEATNAS